MLKIDAAIIETRQLISDKFAELVITSKFLADGSVTTAKLSDLAVTSLKIANGSVSAVKLADGSVTTSKLIGGAVTADKIADGAVSAVKIINSAIGAGLRKSGTGNQIEVYPGEGIKTNVNGLHISLGPGLKIVNNAVEAKLGDGLSMDSNNALKVTFESKAPGMNGTANAGGLQTVSHSDHVHPSDTSRVEVNAGSATGILDVDNFYIQTNNDKHPKLLAWSVIKNVLKTIFVTGVKGNAESAYRIGNVNITPTNIGLENVDNTADIDKPISNPVKEYLDEKIPDITTISVDGYKMVPVTFIDVDEDSNPVIHEDGGGDYILAVTPSGRPYAKYVGVAVIEDEVTHIKYKFTIQNAEVILRQIEEV